MENLDFDKLFGIVTTFMDAPTGKAIIGLIGIVLIIGLVIAKYFWDKNKREKLSWKLTYETEIKKLEDTVKAQEHSVGALVQGMETLEKRNYDYFVTNIKLKKYDSVYYKVHESKHLELKEFLYNESLSAEARAALVVRIVRNESISI